MLHHKVLTHPSSTEWTIFIHGFGGSSNVWFKQIRDFQENFNVVLIDLRGHGKSKGLPQHRRYSFELIAKEVAEVINFLKSKATLIIQSVIPPYLTNLRSNTSSNFGLAPIKKAYTSWMAISFIGLISNDKSYFNYFRRAGFNQIK
jgi:hypothetical protein